MGNSFLNAQQMIAQLAIYLSLSMPLHQASRSFQFINTSEEQSKAEVLHPQYMCYINWKVNQLRFSVNLQLISIGIGLNT
jgi:hypothetical protein